MASPAEHVFDFETGEHVSTSSGDDGACLSRHEGFFVEGDSCSHRWQGYRTAEDNPNWYNNRAYEALKNHRFKTYRPKSPTAWNLDQDSVIFRTNKQGKAIERTVPNFRELASVPYAHNSHHLIPNGVFNSALLAAANVDMRLFWVARVALMKARYNLNHKTNVVILPMRRYVAKALGLPRHISGIDSKPGDSPERLNHSAYNDKVRVQVEEVITDFAQQIDLNECDAEVPEFAKARLETYSETLLTRLKAWSEAAGAGQAINKAPDTVFAAD